MESCRKPTHYVRTGTIDKFMAVFGDMAIVAGLDAARLPQLEDWPPDVVSDRRGAGAAAESATGAFQSPRGLAQVSCG